jgi:hypothetical protein
VEVNDNVNDDAFHSRIVDAFGSSLILYIALAANPMSPRLQLQLYEKKERTRMASTLMLNALRVPTLEEKVTTLALYDFLRTVSNHNNVMYADDFPEPTKLFVGGGGNYVMEIYPKRLLLKARLTAYLLDEVALQMEARREEIDYGKPKADK